MNDEATYDEATQTLTFSFEGKRKSVSVAQALKESKNWHAVRTNNLSLLCTCRDEAAHLHPIHEDSALASILRSFNAHKRFSYDLYSKLVLIVQNNLKAIEGA